MWHLCVFLCLSLSVWSIFWEQWLRISAKTMTLNHNWMKIFKYLQKIENPDMENYKQISSDLKFSSVLFNADSNHLPDWGTLSLQSAQTDSVQVCGRTDPTCRYLEQKGPHSLSLSYLHPKCFFVLPTSNKWIAKSSSRCVSVISLGFANSTWNNRNAEKSADIVFTL